jgi:transaldolase/glucose-6-phosphate isomerase
VVLGMGGSSLAPEVLGLSLPKTGGAPVLTVLDSTDPDQIRSLWNELDPAHTLFIVSSKSGTTLEPALFLEYFWQEAVKALGSAAAARRFVAITDPWSALEKAARDRSFGHIFLGRPGVGGRYSALSVFGLVPAAAAGANIEPLLTNARAMQRACGPAVPPEDNPGVFLGLALGVLARAGRDKLTFVLSPGISDFGAWLEQLIAESTGKQGKGLIPVWGEPLGPPETYGEDRIFAALALTDDFDPASLRFLASLEEAGHPVLRIRVSRPHALAQEFFRWEIATAVAGALIGINPFDQPDVEASKVQTRRLTKAFEETGQLAEDPPEEGLRVYADEKNSAELTKLLGGEAPTLTGLLAAHWSRAAPGDYCAILAYLRREAAIEKTLHGIREALRAELRLATCLGFGPRFLHSTGQAYKGGPNSGLFLQLTSDKEKDLPIPGRSGGSRASAGRFRSSGRSRAAPAPRSSAGRPQNLPCSP